MSTINTKGASVAIYKDSNKKIIMQIPKENDLMLGYANQHDLLSTVFGVKLMVINLIASFFAIISTFITDYVYDDAKAIYILLALIAVDAVTGIMKAVKVKKFSSSKLPRILVIMVIYTTMLGLSWNISKVSPFYVFLPGILYGGFISTLIISIFENLHELKYVPDNLYNLVRGKLDLIQAFVFGKNFNKKGKK